MLSKLLCLVFITCLSSNLLAAEKVVLQLKWEHEFQFAGYYAAKWQGFYAEQGLDVEIRSAIRPNKSIITPSNELRKGRAQFAIGASDILLNKNKGDDPVILASIFQRNPIAIFALQKTDISNLKKLAKLRIAGVKSSFSKMQLETLFASQGYGLENINFVNHPVTIDTLINDKADAIITYEVSAEFAANEKNIKLNKLTPANIGFEFYGDSLYTSFKYSKNHPEIVRKFTEASKKGWLYALEHKKEIAKRIADELPRYLVKYNDPYAYNIAFSEVIDDLLEYPEKPIGYINAERWLNMNEKIRSLGLIRSHLNDNLLHFATALAPKNSNKHFYYLPIIAFFLPLIIFFWHRQYKIATILALLLAMVTLEIQLEEIFIKEEKLVEKEKLQQQLNSVSGKLQANLQQNLSTLTGFAAYISATPHLSNTDFNRYAKVLFQKNPILNNFAAAKNLVVNYVYPLAGNEKAIGLNYRLNPSQLISVEQAIKSKQVQISGLVNLVQGGTAFIGRAPVFLENDKLWGVISAPLDAQLLFKYSGIKTAAEKINIAIRNHKTDGTHGKVFFGDPAIFSSPDKSEAKISVADSFWHIAATPKTINAQLPNNIYILRLYFSIFGFILSLLTWLKFQQASEKKQFERQLQEDKKLLESVGRVAKIGGWKLNKQFEFLEWSEQASLTLGKPRNFRPNALADLKPLFSNEEYQLWVEKVEAAIKASKAFNINLQLALEEGETLWLRVMSDGEKIDNDDYISGTLQDITDKVLSDQLIEYQASYDSLTNLPNRLFYHDRLKQVIKKAHRNSQKLAILFIDLDRFKPINDNHGHQTGDLVLIEAATRLKNMVRDSDTVSRLSGDEFSIILNDISDYKHVLTIAEKISETMQQPYQVDSFNVHLSVSIGIAIYPDDAKDADSLLKKADQAMYEVKANGRNGYQFYTQEMQLKSERRHQLLNKLIEAINKKHLQPYFQPIIELKSQKIAKCETLARWQQANGEFVSPIEFIHLAEESGLINKIDLLMLVESSKALMEIDNNIELSINVSPRLFQTRDNSLQNWISAIKEISQSIKLTVEITERLLTDDSEKALTILNQLKSVGIKIAIDDFGTGYSSLNYLVKFPVDIIKIDRSFIKKIALDNASEALIETILAMAKRLSIQVVAEGIETKEQLTYLEKHHCDFGQGYYLGKPMSKENFRSLLKK